MIFVTGGVGFVGLNFVLDWLEYSGELAVNLDKLVYGGKQKNQPPLTTVVQASARKSFPIYGEGQQIHDWRCVKDHCSTIRRPPKAGKRGGVCNVGGRNGKKNIEVVHAGHASPGEPRRKTNDGSYKEQIIYVKGTLIHDRRYVIDARKIEREFGWRPAETFDGGIRKTVQGWLERQDQVHDQSGDCLKWTDQSHPQRDCALERVR